MSAPIIITVPKYVAISPGPVQKVVERVKTANLVDNSDNGKSRKRRLDHLTWEEKLQRKKLKNRVAAQTSRDRKKAKMDDMEHTISVLSKQTEILQNKCDSLQVINESLSTRNNELEKQIEELKNEMKELKQNTCKQSSATSDNVSSCVGFESSDLNRSAVSSTFPLPKGLELKSTKLNHKDSTVALWRIIALCLLYKSCSKISMQDGWKNLPKVYSQISPKTWKEVLQRVAQQLPKVQAVQSDCLDQWWGPQQNSWNPAKIAVPA